MQAGTRKGEQWHGTDHDRKHDMHDTCTQTDSGTVPTDKGRFSPLRHTPGQHSLKKHLHCGGVGEVRGQHGLRNHITELEGWREGSRWWTGHQHQQHSSQGMASYGDSMKPR